MKKKRAVKEGSPFEEEYLLELLKDDTKCTPEDKETVKSLMKALLYFGMVEESVQLHTLVANVIKATLQAQLLHSVEQE